VPNRPNEIGDSRPRSAVAARQRALHDPVAVRWEDDPSASGEPNIVINLTTQEAFFYRGEALIGQTNISSGQKAYETPPGTYRVTQKDENHISSQYGQIVSRSGAVLVRDADANTTPRPKGACFVGASMPYFLRFKGGYGMHAGFVPPYPASHGCVRLPEAMAKHFFDAAEVGTRVEVIEPPIMVER
jgi:lipoprotein-anchoring transpeptidase ErfK/SrfK